MMTTNNAARPNFGILSVLIVEDTAFMRLLITSVLKALGVENVHLADNGVSAVKLIKERMKTLPDGTPPFDLVISDVIMPEVDGFMLMRFIRTSADSPDRFMPVAMISGASDAHFVAKARDLGANEFIAKPFSPQVVWDRLMSLVYKPRRYVLANGYFGPDRRRFNRPVAQERRIRKPEDAMVIRNNTKKIKLDTTDILFFEFANRLAAKVGGLANNADMPKLDPEIAQQVQAKIEAVAGDYTNWVADELKKLEAAVIKLRQPEANIRGIIGTINRSAHEMRGQGGIFGYPLVTEFAKSLFLTTSRNYPTLSDNEFELLKAHVDAIKAVITQKIEGDGGDVGRELLMGLQIAIKKYG